MRAALLAVVALAALPACRTPPRVDDVPAADATIRAADFTPPPERRPGGCETLVDVEAPDTLRLDGDVALYANEQIGVAVVDVSDPDAPKVLGVSEIKGTPVGVFALGGAAVVVYAPWDRDAVTVVRAVSIAPATPGRTIGERELAGAPRDARRVGDFVVVTRETPAGRTAVAAFTLDANGLAPRDELELRGKSAVAGAAPTGVAIARTSEAGADRTAVTWLGLDAGTGVFTLQGTATIDGVIPRWRGVPRVIDVSEDGQVRLVTCPTAACPVDGPAAYASVDFSQPDRPRAMAWSLVARAGDGVVGFQGTRLVVARPAVDRSDATELAFFRTDGALAPAGSVRLRGSVGSVVVEDSGDVVTVGWTGNATTGRRAIVHHVDGRGVPRLVGAATFGGDWTWTRAYDDERVMGFDRGSLLAALPMTTLRGRHQPTAAVQVLSLDPSGPRAIAEKPAPFVDRLMFVDGRLLAFSADGVTVVRREGEQGAEQTWDDLRSR
ncbi:MAG: hypothetical protein KIT84_16430 [Labilithrix sp.]|nr:hypothetical protein [Labilithrix sp.]MCW5812617.1 hypothetical protein [Labilithrix sp.]